jgi:ribosomal protein S18 acetylase RimI-like enzyme
MASSFEVVPCPAELRPAALGLVFRGLSPEQQVAIIESLPVRKGNLLGPFDALFVAVQGEHLVAAVWAQPQAGRIATLWLPQFADVHDAGIAGELIQAAVRRTSAFEVVLVQAIVEPADESARDSVKKAGLLHIADLIYLEWPPAALQVAPFPALHFETFDPSQKARWKRVLAETYVGSLDCPQLDSLRSLDDVLDGYQATGDFDPEVWLLGILEGNDVAVLLLAPYTKTQQMELIYMGVVPSARGRGIGAAILRQAQEMSHVRQAKKLVLAVDAANAPARALYEQAGFFEWSRRSIYIYAILECA